MQTLGWVVLFITSVNSYGETQLDWEQIKTPQFEFLTQQVCEEEEFGMHNRRLEAEKDAREVANPGAMESYNAATDFFSWTPDGTPFRVSDLHCQASALEQELSQTSNVKVQALILEDYFARCGSHLSRMAPDNLSTLLRLSNTRYDLCRNSRIRKYKWRLPNGTVIRGMLSLKPGSQPRPLVIFKCGVFCNPGDSSQRFMMMHLFDESPFHVLAVANVTGADYVHDNGHLALGGLDEGMQLISAAKAVRHLPFASKISKVHFVGVSLGSHGGLYASYFNEYNRNPDGSKPFDSFLALCPVVDLQSSIENIFKGGGILSQVARYFFVAELARVIEDLPILRDLFPNPSEVDPNTIPDKIAEAAVSYYKTKGPKWILPPLQDSSIQTKEDLWRLNRFADLPFSEIQQPVLILASENDWIVPTFSNSLDLKDKIKDGPGSMQVVVTPYGNHCGQNIIYGWDTASAIFRSFVMSQESDSPLKSLETDNKHTVPADWNSSLELWSMERHFSQKFKAFPEQSQIEVSFQIFSPLITGHNCFRDSPYDASFKCFREVRLRAPLSIFGDLSAPRNEPEAESLTRWLNNHARIQDAMGQPLQESAAKPVFVHTKGLY